MSALDAIGGRALAHPVSGEVIEYDDLEGIKRALAETEDYLRRPEVRRMWNARDALQERLVELDPIGLPRPARQTDKQRRVERCPRCKSFLPSEPEPSPEPEARVGADPVRGADNLDVAGPASSGSETVEQSELLPQGPRSAEQDAALGLTVFGEKLESLDPVVKQAGEIVIPQGKRAGRTVADVAEHDPDWCLWYLEAGKTETLKAAITTYLYAVKPELMEDSK